MSRADQPSLAANAAAPRPGMPQPTHVGRIEKAGDPRSALSRLLPYLKPFRGAMRWVLGLLVLYTFLGLIGPYLLGVAIDELLHRGDPAALVRLALAMLATYVSCNVLQGIAGRLMADISQRALKQLRSDLFRCVQQLPVSFFGESSTGDLLSRLTNDIEAINQAISQNVTTLVASLLSMLGILVAMFLLDRFLAMASLLVVPIMFWFTQFVARYTRKGFRDLQRDLGLLNGVMEEAISGQKTAQAFRRKQSAIEAFQRHNQRVFEAGVSANSYALLLMPITSVLGNLFVIVLAALGSWLALAGLVSVGIIATFINYAQQFVNPLRQLANLYNSIQSALAGAERIFAVFDVPPETDETDGMSPLANPRGEVRFEHVRFGYSPGSTVLEDLSFAAEPGQVVALVGPTGAGKTTIINLLTRFYEIESGTIRIDGRDIRSIPKPDLRKHLGLVLQDVFLFSDSVLENIRYGRLDASDEEVMEAAKLAEADAFIRLLPAGYRTQLSERAGNLSQGQRQLLAIARAILADPAILILDEATSSVDTRTEARIQRALLALMKGRTSFVIAHRLSTIAEADQILVIDHGTLAEQGKHAELLTQRGVYHRLYTSQFKGEAI
ncbi:MAG TPA: ABC transporter ATP-binding protein [Polyangiaceae bacterium]|nr:ABC transporter ATP-binding protein [Polyangiaceae bacterium]